MPNSNVAAHSSFSGASDTKRHGFAPARRETEAEKLHRHQIWVDDAKQLVDDFNNAMHIKYVNRTINIR